MIGLFQDSIVNVFEYSKRTTFIFQIVPSILQALIAIGFMYIYLNDVQRTTRILFIAIFVLCFFPMGTIIVECHLNYALWANVVRSEWLAYRQAWDMRLFLGIFLIPFYLPIVLLIVFVCKRAQRNIACLGNHLTAHTSRSVCYFRRIFCS